MFLFLDIRCPGCANNIVTHQFIFYRRYGSDGVQCQLRTSGDRVRPLSNNDAVCYESSSSLVKNRSQKRPAFQFASRWRAGTEVFGDAKMSESPYK